MADDPAPRPPPLPSLIALRAVEAAVRRASFTAAADELGVTHGAVSRHVRSLELTLGVELFERTPRRVAPTYTGRMLGADLTPLFAGVADAVDNVRRRPERLSLRLSVGPSFASQWLLPRLSDFRRGAPEMEIDIDSTPHLADVAAGPIDLAVRYFEAPAPAAPPGCALAPLVRMQAFPAAAPDVAAGLAGDRGAAGPAEIARLPLIHEDGREAWRAWFKAAGLPPPPPRAGLLVNDLAHGVIAAERGEGALLIDPVLGADALAAGRLVPLSPLRIPIGGYWLVRPNARPASRPARAFTDWIAARLAAAGSS